MQRTHNRHPPCTLNGKIRYCSTVTIQAPSESQKPKLKNPKTKSPETTSNPEHNLISYGTRPESQTKITYQKPQIKNNHGFSAGNMSTVEMHCPLPGKTAPSAELTQKQFFPLWHQDTNPPILENVKHTRHPTLKPRYKYSHFCVRYDIPNKLCLSVRSTNG